MLHYHLIWEGNNMRYLKLLLIIKSFVLATTASANVTANNDSNAELYKELIPYYYAAARTGDDEVITEFLKAGLPIDVKNSKGYTALMIATYHGRASAVNALLASGANVCAEDNKGNTALMAAIFKGEFRIAKQLITTDCDTNHQNKAGQTAVMYATLFGRKELTKVLIERGADVTLQDFSGNSATTLTSN